MPSTEDRKATPGEVRREASRYIAFELGDYLWPGEPAGDHAGGWRVGIHSRSLPDHVEIGHLTLDASAHVVETPSRSDVERAIERAKTGALFFQRYLDRGLAFAAAAEGERILVADAGIEVPMTFLVGPEVDREGVVHFAFGMDQATLATLGELSSTFVLEIVFMPTLDVIVSQRCDEDQIERLSLYGGLAVTTTLPDVQTFLEPLGLALDRLHLERLRLPRRAFEVRLRLQR